MWVGDGVVVEGWLGVLGKGKGDTKKYDFLRGWG